MQLKTTDFVFDVTESELGDGLFVIKVKKQVESRDSRCQKIWEWSVSNKTLYISYSTGFLEAIQKMIKWAYTEAF